VPGQEAVAKKKAEKPWYQQTRGRKEQLAKSLGVSRDGGGEAAKLSCGVTQRGTENL